jgi:predicted DNA-binding transcriptional regulator AlpA
VPSLKLNEILSEVQTMRFLRVRQVMALTRLSRMTIYRLELAERFPKRIRIPAQATADKSMRGNGQRWTVDGQPSIRTEANDRGIGVVRPLTLKKNVELWPKLEQYLA